MLPKTVRHSSSGKTQLSSATNDDESSDESKGMAQSSFSKANISGKLHIDKNVQAREFHEHYHYGQKIEDSQENTKLKACATLFGKFKSAPNTTIKAATNEISKNFIGTAEAEATIHGDIEISEGGEFILGCNKKS